MALRSATLEPVGQALLDDVVGDLFYSRSAQFLLGLASELGLWHRHLDRGHQTLLDILFGRPVLIFLGQFGELPGVLEEDVVDGPGECAVKARHVGSTVGGRNGVHERLDDAFVVLHPPQGDLNGAVPFHVAHLFPDWHSFREGLDPGEGHDLADVGFDG